MKKLTNLLILTSLLFGILLTDGCKKDKSLAVLTTTNITGITVNSASTGGNITSSGGADITARGVCWSTSRTPVISGSHTSDGTGSGSFTSSLTGLTANTLYYVRAYATNSVGTAYGNEVSFTTSEVVLPTLTTAAVSAISLTTATSGGEITNDGGGTVSARGVCWATAENPTIADSKTADGTGSGAFTSDLASLTPSTTYYVRAYATNSAGTAYGSQVTFTTAAMVAPTVTTADISAITMISATSGGNVTSDGGATVSARGICWSTTADPTITDSHTTNGTGTGTFASDMTGLTAGTEYHVRAYATNSIGTGYGADVVFTTTPIAPATLTTTAVSAISYTTATSGGNITDAGGGTIVARGVCWATTTNPTIAASHTSDGNGTGTFTSALTGLSPNTTYYVRAYATNSNGTAYGEEVSFTTLEIVAPTLSTTDASAITQTTASSGGNITDNGGGAVTARGVCWAITANPVVGDSHTSDGTGSGVFTSALTGLTPGATYHVRAYATNSAGTGYGPEITFDTDPITEPTVTSTAATAVTQTTATAGGNVTADGGGTVTARGIVYALTANPTLSNTVVAAAAGGTGTFTVNITGLTAGEEYHFRAYATNSAGTAYGSDLLITTSPVLAPTVTTTAVSAVALTTATSGGNVTSDGGGAVTARGVVIGTSPNPTTANTVITTGAGTGVYTSNITGLTASGTLYYLRAYATNSAGTSYGSQVSFTTDLADVDGNTYNTVLIGSQIWTAENLKTTLYANSAPITNITDNTAWSTATAAAYCWYSNDMITNKPKYGAMYNWWAANTDNLCPTGWHVPAEVEWSTLEVSLGLDAGLVGTWDFRGTDQATQMKATTGWTTGNGTNTSGFTAVPGGYRYNVSGAFFSEGSMTYFWASDELDAARGWYRRIDGADARVNKGATEKPAGKYIRCVKD